MPQSVVLFESSPWSNTLSSDKKTLAVSMLCEGSSIRAIERVTGIHRETPMKWIEFWQAIAVESERFSSAPLLNVGGDPKTIDTAGLIAIHKQAEIDSRQEIEADIRFFITEQTWPESLSGNRRYFVQQRLSVAAFIIGYLACPLPGKTPTSPLFPEPPDTFSDRQKWEWVLIHGWNSIGWVFWFQHQRIRCEMLKGKNPNYPDK